ncbi:ribosomal protein S5 domain 2-type protein [Crassisporium funariophilum]|nr:ribosomal protein S5 domain 2-type protein [Crassisporium funariophilum]
MASTSISKAEKSYIQAGLLADPPLRADGRALSDFRTVSLETGIAPLANGSARLSIGKNPHDGSGGTEVLAAVKVEVENIDYAGGSGVEGGRVACTVTCSPAAYPHLRSEALDDLQYDMTTVLHETLSHSSLHPQNLAILRGKKSWLLNLDLVILADSGNAYDAIFMAAKAALWDTKVPRTRSVEYKAKKTGPTASVAVGGGGSMDVDEDTVSGFDTRQITHATDFELPDYWDEGEVLDGRHRWPVCITLNLVPPAHLLDATTSEEAAIPLRLLIMFSFESKESPSIQGMRMLGSGELTTAQLADLIKVGEKYAQEINSSLNVKLKDEDLRRNQKARERFAQR